jgi:uncharacterized YigZ family protein
MLNDECRKYNAMSDNWSYKTVREHSTDTYKEKGSRFIGLIVACHSESEIKAQLERWRTEHNQATHLCYAYRLGSNGERYRANDDGEPSNSAGQPILGQLISAGITNVLCGVVRYYGGTKLGVGGLIQAYREAAKLAIEASVIVQREEECVFRIEFDYADMPAVLALVKRSTRLVQPPEISDRCAVVVSCPVRHAASMKSQLTTYKSVSIIPL